MTAKPQQRQVRCGQGVITYLLTRKKVKNVNLRIKQDGSVLVSACKIRGAKSLTPANSKAICQR